MATKRIISPVNRDKIKAINDRIDGLEERPTGSSSNINILDDLFLKGREDRIRRYDTYDAMDKDTDIARALDMIAEHCTNRDPDSGIPFTFNLDEDELTQDDTEVLNDFLKSWSNLNEWDNRIFRTIRNLVKYGDAFFIRDPDTLELKAISARKVVGAYVDSETQEIEAYLMKDMTISYDYMIDDLTSSPTASTYVSSNGASATYNTGFATATNKKTKNVIVPRKHVIHLSLSEGQDIGGNGQNDDLWPFGESFLEQIYKDYKNRDLLEQAALIHRIQRAPSRRVWYLDVGKQRGDRATATLEKFKNALLHKKIPERFGNTQSIDSAYNPISTMEDIYIPITADARGSKVETMEGQQWNGLDDLEYFTSKVMRGLRVPSSFMLGPEEGGASYNDGRVGTAFIQEIQFARFCLRIQELLDNYFDREFKLYLKLKGIQIHSADYQLKFLPPMNFEEYREGALDDDRLNRLSQATNFQFISKRFAMQKYGRFTHDEILKNERMWIEENRGDDSVRDAQNNDMGGMGAGSSTFNNFASNSEPLVPLGDDNFNSDDEFGGELGGGISTTSSGATIPQTGGAGGLPDTGPPGTESRMVKNNKKLIFEEIEVPDNREEPQILSIPADKLFANSLNNGEILTLRHIRKLRLEKERSRIELAKRLADVGKIYSSSGDNSAF